MPKYDTAPARMPGETGGNDGDPTTKGGNPPTTGVTQPGVANGIFWYIFCSILGD